MSRLHHFRISPRLRPRHAFVLAIALSLAACGPNIPKADALEAQADGLMGGQAYIAAIAAMEKSVAYDSNEPRRWVKLGRAQRAAGMPALAARSYQHALDLDPANVESLQNLAILDVRAGRFDDAKIYVDPLMVLSPDDVAGLLALGAIALDQKNLPEGMSIADRLIRVAPQSVSGYSLKARVLDSMGHPAEAAKILAQQAVLNPDDPEVATQLLQTYRKAGNRQGVRDVSVNLARLVPDDPRYQMEAARAAFAQGDKEKGETIVDAVLGRYLYIPEIDLAVAQLWQAMLPADEAVGRIVQLTTRTNGRAKAALAELLMSTGHTGAVVTMLAPLESAKADVGNVEVMAEYAKALLATGQMARAKTVADTVLAFDGQLDTALVVRAKVAFAQKRYADALTDAQIAASANGQNVDAAILVPQIYAAQGNGLLAANAWGDAGARLPDDERVLTMRVNWLLANGQASTAKGLTAKFARSHPTRASVWTLNRTACIAAKDQVCAGEAATAIKQLQRGKAGSV